MTDNNSVPRYVAILNRLDDTGHLKIVPVPDGQSLDMDDQARRPWLHSALGSDYHLVEFVELDALWKVMPYTAQRIERLAVAPSMSKA